MRNRGGWVVLTPFGLFGNRRRTRYVDPYARGYGRPRGGGCARDACLLEGGCCLAESLNGNCLLLLLTSLPALLLGRATPTGTRSTLQGRLLALIATYQSTISARRSRPVCRYSPSCSQFAADVIASDGVVVGCWRTARRLLSCRPGGGGAAARRR